jgi:uncharacterized protein (TIGR00255 family)
MNGYGTAQGNFAGWAIRIAIKSTNHRFLDVKTRVPESLEPFEHQLRQTVRSRIRRGHVDVHIMVEPNEELAINVNRELLRAYMVAAEDLRNRTGGKSELDTVALLRLPGVIGDTASVFPDSEERQQELGHLLESLLQSVLVRADEMRRADGQRLTQELRSRVNKIADQCAQVCDLVMTLRPGYARRLEARLKELLRGSTLEPMSLAQEAALLAERSDITEELDRPQSHLTQFTKLLDDTGEVGKKLDFLLQEMHREVNTMLSKTPGVESEALAITGLSLEIKADIEKLRESVQDIE